MLEPFSSFIPPAHRLPVAGRGLTLSMAGLAALVDDPLAAAWAMDGRGQISLHNEMAGLLLNDSGARAEIEQLAAEVTANRQAADTAVVVAGEPQRHFRVLARPLMVEPVGFLIWCQACETSAREHLIEALKESRALFKSLAEAAGDFAWVVDSQGRFAYVSGGVQSAGLAAWDLMGRPVAELGEEAASCFMAREPLRPTDVWIRTPLGRSVCLSVAAVPVMIGETWNGARGIARDVTEDRRAERLLDAARKRDRLLRQVLDGIRAEGDPSAMLESTARTVREVFAADLCQILRLGGSFESRADWVPQPGRVHRLRADCRLRGAIVGSLVIERRGEPWPKEEELLLDRVAEHIAMAIAQADHGQAIARAMRTDGLTGLLNRRTFEAEMRLRLEDPDDPQPPSGMLLLFALDGFRHVNAALGYKAGDSILIAVAALLNRLVKPGDLAARLSGDSFAVWRPDVDTSSCEPLSRAITQGVDVIRQEAGAARLGVSFGAAARQDAAETADATLRRAEDALYQAKQSRNQA